MKRKRKLHLMGIAILVFCVSCGQSVKETVKPVVPVTASGPFKRVVIVPFADHTPNSSLQEHFRRNTLVLEALQDALYRAGFISAPEEDVVKYLMDQGIIQTPEGGDDSYRTAGLKREMHSGWSEQMQEELQDVLYQDMTSSSFEQNKARKPIALDREILRDLGKTFGADYIVRGRIVEFRSDQKDTFNPIRTGMIPFVFKSGQRTIFGVAKSEGYENIDVDDIEEYNQVRDFFWGAGAFLTGLIGEKQGQVPGATVQLRVLIQDAVTGDVVWLNRAEACAIPRTAFADPDPDLLFAKSIDRAVNSLVADFQSALASGRVPVMLEKQAVAESTGETSKDKGFENEAASAKAEKSALEASRSAQEAKDAAAEAVRASGESKRYAQEAAGSAAEAKDAVKRASEATHKSEKIFEKIIAK